MFTAQLGLLVCIASQGHLHQKHYVLCHHSFRKTQPKEPIQIELNLNSFMIILFPLISMISTSFVKFEVLLSECEKQEWRVCNRFLLGGQISQSNQFNGQPNNFQVTSFRFTFFSHLLGDDDTQGDQSLRIGQL